MSFLPEPTPRHVLDDVAGVTSHTVGWEAQASGGSVPIIAPLDQPHWRWYCRCGAVGGRRPSREAAEADHRRHTEAS